MYTSDMGLEYECARVIEEIYEPSLFSFSFVAFLYIGGSGLASMGNAGSVDFGSDDEGGLSKEDRRKHHNALERYVVSLGGYI